MAYIQSSFRRCVALLISLSALTAMPANGQNSPAQMPRDAAKRLPRWIVIAPSARNIRHTESQGKDQVTYTVDAAYPAQSLLKQIADRLTKLGWTGQKEDWLNPGLPTSLVRGWTYFEDESSGSTMSVRVWQADWRNSRHDVLTYFLQYKCPGNRCASTADLHELRVIAVYLPAEVAKRIKSSVSAAQQEHR